MTKFTKTTKNRISRLPKRGHYERETIYRILDDALICHVGFAENGQPFVIPTNFARVDDRSSCMVQKPVGCSSTSKQKTPSVWK